MGWRFSGESPGGASPGAWERIAAPTVHSGSAVQSLAVAGLAGLDALGEVWLEVRLLLATGTKHVHLETRGNATSASYTTFTRQDGLTVTPTANALDLTGPLSSSRVRFDMDVFLSKRSGGTLTARGVGAAPTVSSSLAQLLATVCDQATTDIDEIAIGSDVAGAILAASSITAYKRVA
jgi:hypothetical protein